MAMNFKTMKIEDMIAWCKEHNELEWLLAKAQETRTVDVYPKVAHKSKTGKNTMKQDKKQAPIGKAEVPISFVEIKTDFCDKFMPDLLPRKKEKAPTMIDAIKAAMTV